MTDRRKLLATAMAALTLPAVRVAAKPRRGATEARATPKPLVHLNVRDFAAAADGTTKDTLAFQQALDRCSLLGGGEVLVPPGQYLIGAIRLGPRTSLRIDAGATVTGSPDLADYPVRQVRWEGKFVKGRIGLISAEDADGVTLCGKGKLVGAPAIRSRIDAASGLRNPCLIEFVNCRHVEVRELDTEQNAMWSIHPLFCEDAHFRDLIVNGGADGIDIDSCKRVVIERCSFDTGDDCIAIKSGRGMEGLTIGRPTEDVRVSDCTFKDRNFACMAIGSETSGGIRGVRVERCKFTGAKTHAVYIKSRPGRGAFIEDIVMTDLEVSGVAQGFLRLNFGDSGKQDEVPVPGLLGMPTLKNFSFSHIVVHDIPALVDAFAIPEQKPLVGFTLTDISGTCGKGISLANIKGAKIAGVKVTGFNGPLLSLHNVTGSGLAGAAALPRPKPVTPAAPAAAPYVLG